MTVLIFIRIYIDIYNASYTQRGGGGGEIYQAKRAVRSSLVA